MRTVEIRLSPGDVAYRMGEMRRWVDARGCEHKFTSTGSSSEAVVLVEFSSEDEATEFARQFAGSLLPS